MAIRTFRNYWRPSHYYRVDEAHYNEIFGKKRSISNERDRLSKEKQEKDIQIAKKKTKADGYIYN